MLLLPLLPTLLALFLGAGPGRERPAWNGALLFGGMAASRVGLWSFDLAQLQMVQEALSTHPRRNSLMALQVSLQNLFDLGHYGLTIGWSLPSQFKYAALTSYCALLAAGVIYVGVYARRDRGHVLHLGWLRLHDTKSR
jgi:iron-regulated transporter 1